jgi:homoserine kinase
MAAPIVVRAPASSANLGPAFDVLGLALDLPADVGVGAPPTDARVADPHHPARLAFEALGGTGELWVRSRIPVGRGLGFSGAVRVAGAAAAAVQAAGGRAEAVEERADDVLSVSAELEGHADNVAASLYGGAVAVVDDRAIPLRIGPRLADAVVVAWVPDTTTSTDRSRRALSADVARTDAVHNISRSVQLALAIERDDPELLAGATVDRLHQDERLLSIPRGGEALDAGLAAGAWCGWLSGSGPTIALLAERGRAPSVAAALPRGGHVKRLRIDLQGARTIEP